MEKQYRYPGTRPFSENDRHLFFGRNNDIKQLSELVVLEKLVVLFSKSGYGKSSLLNAGVIPRLTEEESHKVLNIRLNEQDRNPVELLVHHLKSSESKNIWLNQKFNIANELPDELAANLWFYAKNIQLANKGCKSVTLVFDQFEELFNYNNAQVQEFGKTIASLLNLNMPEAVRLLMKQKMKTDADYFTDTETDQLLEPLNLKVVFSLRNDRLSLLNQLKTYLPAVFKKTYELQPLDEMQALEALLEPATKEGNFASPAFTYTNAATELILKSLKDSEHQRIETFQLQLICQHAEELIIRKATNHQGFKNLDGLELSDTELGKPEDIFEKHYKIIIDGLPENHQYTARILIEDKLIIGGNRVPLPETVITQQHNIAAKLLKTLVDKRLLRSEPNTVGGTSYELSHDTLVAPITKAAEVRRQKEEEEEQLRIRNEELRTAKEKAAKDRKRLILVIGALIIALTLSGIAVWKWMDAEQQEKLAQQKTVQAIKSDSLAQIEKQKALAALVQANESDSLAQIEKQNALIEKASADTARNVAEQQKTKAQKLADGVLELLKRSLPTGVTDVYAYYKQQADTAFTNGDYDNAIGFYQGAKLLAENQAQQTQIQKQISNAEKCLELITQAGNHAFALDLNKAIALKQLQKLNPDDPKAAWRIEAFSRPETLPILQKLKLVTVEGGSFMMGKEYFNKSDETPHKVILTTYQIGTYEVTNQQYAEFLNAYGSTNIKEGEYKGETMIWEYKWGVTNNNGKWQPQEGYESHPVVEVSWYGAYEFCRYYGLNLPTEAQWEFAARGGMKSDKLSKSSKLLESSYKYAGSNNIDEVAWYRDNSDSKTHAVGDKKANELNLYDMSGNVWEWCSDWYSSGYYKISPEKNPQGETAGSSRVLRGGSWSYIASSCRVAIRNDDLADYRYRSIGFRFALSL